MKKATASQRYGVNRTGIPGFEARLTEQLLRNRLTSAGTSKVELARARRLEGKGSEIYMPRYRVTLFGRDYEAMANLVRKHKLTLDVFPHTLRQLDEGGYSVDALANDSQMRSLLEARAVEPEAAKLSGYNIERRERM